MEEAAEEKEIVMEGGRHERGRHGRRASWRRSRKGVMEGGRYGEFMEEDLSEAQGARLVSIRKYAYL